jgi:SAM-dependent methyltransferase
MAQTLIKDFVADVARVVELPDPVYDFGAMQVEAHQDGDLRPLFPGRPYTGVDMRPGPGVDEVMDLRALPLQDGSVGTALCLDTLEHCEDPPQACRELTRVVADGGVCILASVMLFGIHAYPSDYFRFTPEAFRSMLAGFDDVWAFGVGDPGIPTQVVAVAAKGRTLGLTLDALPGLTAAQRHYEAGEGRVHIGPFRYRVGEVLRPLARQLPRLARDRLLRR